MRPSILLTAALGALSYPSLVFGFSAANAQSEYAVREVHPVPAGWRAIRRAPEDLKLEMRFGLKQSDFAGLQQRLLQNSDPRHPRFRMHLSASEVNEYTRPSQHTSDLVHEWLFEHGVAAEDISYTAARDWIKVKLSVAQVEDLLDATYYEYVNGDGQTMYRTPEWSLPLHLHDHISTISPTNSFANPKAQFRVEKRNTNLARISDLSPEDLPPAPSSSSIDHVCNTNAITPACLRTLYGTLNYTQQASDRNTMSLVDFLGEVNIRSDAKLFLQRFRPEAVAGANFTQVSIDGGTLNQVLNSTELEDNSGFEGNLDAQTMLGIAWPTALITYSTGGSPPFQPDLMTPTDSNEPYLAWLEYILALPDPLPSVVSASYGDDEQTVPRDYATNVCNQFAQLGARGVTVLFATGDFGVGSAGSCLTNDGKNSSTFLPAFPASCPYVTAVGGTYKFNPEVAVFVDDDLGLFTGGGGFSNYFEAPDYQKTVVADYISNSLTGQYNYSGLFNPNGRGYPDVSGQALNYSVYWNSSLHKISGTSAAAPAIAAVMVNVNDALLAANKSTLGFLNPMLYSTLHPAFNDVTQGSNAGCNTAGYPAVDGWDAATGWGTPNFYDIVALLNITANNTPQNSSSSIGGSGNTTTSSSPTGASATGTSPSASATSKGAAASSITPSLTSLGSALLMLFSLLSI